jgi:hypothetical protein
MNDVFRMLGPQVDSGLLIANTDMVQAAKPYRELQYFCNTIHMERRKDLDEELSELATAPDRWFTKLKSFVGTEPALDLWQRVSRETLGAKRGANRPAIKLAIQERTRLVLTSPGANLLPPADKESSPESKSSATLSFDP